MSERREFEKYVTGKWTNTDIRVCTKCGPWHYERTFTQNLYEAFEAGRLAGLEQRAKEFSKAVSNHHYWKERAQIAERALDRRDSANSKQDGGQVPVSPSATTTKT